MSTWVPMAQGKKNDITLSPGVLRIFLHNPIPLPLTSKANTTLNIVCITPLHFLIDFLPVFESVNNTLLTSVCF